MKNFLISLLYENGVASRTGLAALFLILSPMGVLLFLTMYMVGTSKDFSRYEAFIGAAEWMVTVGVGLLGYNKTITLKNNRQNGGNTEDGK